MCAAGTSQSRSDVGVAAHWSSDKSVAEDVSDGKRWWVAPKDNTANHALRSGTGGGGNTVWAEERWRLSSAVSAVWQS